MSIASNIRDLSAKLPPQVSLVAVSKTQPVSKIMEAYDAGQRIFGENRVQELIMKQQQLPGDIEWHLIGHLQTNKVKQIVPFVALIHSVDSLKLLLEIEREANKINREVHCLLQFHIAQEETKFGLSVEEAESILEDPSFGRLEHAKITGVMGMATYTDDAKKVSSEFSTLAGIFNHLKSSWFKRDLQFKILSMGMTGDYKLAIEEGSTMVRLGTLIFGARGASG